MTDIQHIVELKNLSVGYKSPLLSGINVVINSGEIILLAGRNGSGKTTLLKTLYKELSGLEGTVEVNGKNVSEISFSDLARQIAVVLSKSLVSPSLKVFDLIALGRYPYKKWYEKLSDFEKEEIINLIHLLRLEEYKNYYVSELSDGNLQKVMIARALVQDSPLIVLDEPTSFLDISNKLEIIKLLKFLAKERNKTIVFTSHDLTLGMSVADQLWLIRDKKLISGYTEDIARQYRIYEYFGGVSTNFDYQHNEFTFNEVKSEKKVEVVGDTENIFWLKKALSRNGFDIVNHSDIVIQEKSSGFHLSYKTENLDFENIKKVILYLNSKP